MIATLTRVAGEGFRIFFLSALVFALVSVSAWMLWLVALETGGPVPALPFGDAPWAWHAHEMVFGYASAAVGGFLLTAVPNWTGGAAARRGYVAIAAGLWLAGRVAMWLAPVWPATLVAVLDLAFLPALILKIAVMLVRRPKLPNVMFLVFLTLYWGANLVFHLGRIGAEPEIVIRGAEAGLLALGVMIAVLGGRVTPAFTRNAMKRAGVMTGWPVNRRPADLGAVAGLVLLAVAMLLGAPAALTGGLAIVAGVAQLVRVAGWRPGWAVRQPILVALHVGAAVLGLGLIALGLADLGIGPRTGAVHLLGIGAVGGMTLAVMSRAALGHAGRPLVAPVGVALGYAALPIAAGLRWGAEIMGGDVGLQMTLTAAVLWLAGFALSLAPLLAPLTAPKPSESEMEGG